MDSPPVAAPINVLIKLIDEVLLMFLHKISCSCNPIDILMIIYEMACNLVLMMIL